MLAFDIGRFYIPCGPSEPRCINISSNFHVRGQQMSSTPESTSTPNVLPGVWVLWAIPAKSAGSDAEKIFPVEFTADNSFTNALKTFAGTWSWDSNTNDPVVLTVTTDERLGLPTPYYVSGFLVGGAMGGGISSTPPNPQTNPDLGIWSGCKPGAIPVPQ
jgi:hypothetical protein